MDELSTFTAAQTAIESTRKTLPGLVKGLIAATPGVTNERVATALGIAVSTLYARLRGDSSFTAEEVAGLAELVDLPVGAFFMKAADALAMRQALALIGEGDERSRFSESGKSPRRSGWIDERDLQPALVLAGFDELEDRSRAALVGVIEAGQALGDESTTDSQLIDLFGTSRYDTKVGKELAARGRRRRLDDVEVDSERLQISTDGHTCRRLTTAATSDEEAQKEHQADSHDDEGYREVA